MLLVDTVFQIVMCICIVSKKAMVGQKRGKEAEKGHVTVWEFQIKTWQVCFSSLVIAQIHKAQMLALLS